VLKSFGYARGKGKRCRAATQRRGKWRFWGKDSKELKKNATGSWKNTFGESWDAKTTGGATEPPRLPHKTKRQE